MPATPPNGSNGPNGPDAADELDWRALPGPVGQRLAALAAAALPGLTGADLPPSVRPVVRFTPSKRARLGAAALIGALQDSRPFRAAVVSWLREHRSDDLDAARLDGTDPVGAASAAVLLGEPDAAQRVAVLSRQVDDDRLRIERDAALARVDRLAVEVGRLQRKLAAAHEAGRNSGATRDAELERLRGRLREQGARLRAALDGAAGAAEDRNVDTAELRRALAATEVERDRERERADAARRQAARAAADAETARHAAREARQADEVRLTLLVETLAGAVTGLRRELALGEVTSTGSRPADLVAGAAPSQAVASRVEDPAALDRLLALSAAHLVVDGYNVTKTGYPDLTLSAQRDRLAAALAALAARTGVEVTVVFDGAAVVGVPVAAPRGVRVLFSDPGVLADDVIRAIAAAEPQGRPVVVVTSDRAVADAVRRCGAHPVPAAVLLARLSRI